MSTSSASSATPGVYSSDVPPPPPIPSDAEAEDEHRGGRSARSRTRPGHDDGKLERTRSAEVEEPRAAAASNGKPPSVVPGVVDVAATSSVSAEAQQGEGPAAAGASASGVGRGIAQTSVVSVVIGPEGAAAACEHGAVVAGPHGAAAASQAGVAAVGQNGAASSSNAANATSAAVNGNGNGNGHQPQHAADLLARLARLEEESRELRARLQ